jgi:hypothetical protein
LTKLNKNTNIFKNCYFMSYEDCFITGFVKAAANAGIDSKQALEILKQAEAPFRQQEAAKVRAYDESITANEYNRENHPYHYLLNPFVEGPISEVKNRAMRRFHTMHALHPYLAATDWIAPPVNAGASIAKLFMAGDERKQKAREFRPGKPDNKDKKDKADKTAD